MTTKSWGSRPRPATSVEQKTLTKPVAQSTIIPAYTPNTQTITTVEDKLNIVLIDSFSPNLTDRNDKGECFNHGKTMAGIIEKGGVALEPSGQINVISIKIDIDSYKRTAMIARALSNVYFWAIEGQIIDAVVIPQEDFVDSAYTHTVQAQAELLQALGIPVIFAAGNSGPNSHNAMTLPKTFNAMATYKSGKALDQSGTGNIKAVAGSTSYACASLGPYIAYLHRTGLSIDDIHAQIVTDMDTTGSMTYDNPTPFEVVWDPAPAEEATVENPRPQPEHAPALN